MKSDMKTQMMDRLTCPLPLLGDSSFGTSIYRMSEKERLVENLRAYVEKTTDAQRLVDITEDQIYGYLNALYDHLLEAPSTDGLHAYKTAFRDVRKIFKGEYDICLKDTHYGRGVESVKSLNGADCTLHEFKRGFCYSDDDYQELVTCHRGTTFPMGIPADMDVRRMRAATHKMLDDIFVGTSVSKDSRYRFMTEAGRQLGLSFTGTLLHISSLSRDDLGTLYRYLDSIPESFDMEHWEYFLPEGPSEDSFRAAVLDRVLSASVRYLNDSVDVLYWVLDEVDAYSLDTMSESQCVRATRQLDSYLLM